MKTIMVLAALLLFAGYEQGRRMPTSPPAQLRQEQFLRRLPRRVAEPGILASAGSPHSSSGGQHAGHDRTRAHRLAGSPPHHANIVLKQDDLDNVVALIRSSEYKLKRTSWRGTGWADCVARAAAVMPLPAGAGS